jgi:hypothetical protein
MIDKALAWFRPFQALTGIDRAGTITEQALQSLPVRGLDANCGIERKASAMAPLAASAPKTPTGFEIADWWQHLGDPLLTPLD